MKIANSASPLIVSEGFDPNVSIMGMSQEDALQMAKHLRDTVYTNKVLAVVREYLSNSFDEHTKFKIERPVETGVREIDGNYEFFARDYAKGLSEHDIRNVFGVYGNSSKNKNNDSIGSYGIGGRAFFAYSDTFFVHSCFEGTKTTYSCVIGGDEQGSSNGFLYKVHSESTTETGLEVFGTVKPEDFSKFNDEIQRFVSFSPHKIVANILSQEFSPCPVVLKETHEGIEFTLFAGHSGHKNTLAVLQMGGVKYEHIELPEGFGVKADHTLVVNVPIGSMTVALSRESFHDTPSNQNFKAKIAKILEEMTQRDFAHLKAKPLKDFIDENLGELHINKQVEGEIFKTRIAYVYPETAKLIGNLAYMDHGAVAQKNSKPLLILIPNNKATDHWKDKLRQFSRASGQSYYFACHREFISLSPEGKTEINQYFSPIGVKSLKFPKTTKQKLYTVYRKDRNIGKVNAMGFANLLRTESFNLPEENDLAALKVWINDEKAKAILSRDTVKLQRLSIACTPKSRHSGWTCQSSELTQEIEDLGLFNRHDGEYTKICQQWSKEDTERQAKQAKIKNALKSWTTFHPRTVELIKKEKNSERLNKFWTAVMSEPTTRNKLFTHIQASYESYNGSKNKLTREEFRAIMRLERN